MGLIGYYLKKLFKIFKGEVLVLPSRIVVLLFFLFVILLPVFNSDAYILRVFILAGIFAILYASWDLLSGFTGQMNFGQALFFGVAAYTAAFANVRFGIPAWGSIPLGALAAVLAGLIIGIPCLRLRGTYLALTTLAFPIILIGIVYAMPELTGGELGLYGLHRMASSYVGNYYVTSIVMLASVFAMWLITDSNTGIIFHAIREDEVAVRASGINTTRYKLIAFCLSGFFAGIAGGLYAHFMRIAEPSTLSLNTSFLVVIYAIFGGVATIYGPVGAVFLLFPLLEFLRFWPEYRMLMFAVVVLLTLLFMPEGLFPWLRDKIEEECPRCKIRNIATRKTCRICDASLE